MVQSKLSEETNAVLTMVLVRNLMKLEAGLQLFAEGSTSREIITTRSDGGRRTASNSANFNQSSHVNQGNDPN